MRFFSKSPAISRTPGRLGKAKVGSPPTATALGCPRVRGFSIARWAIVAAALLAGCNPPLQGNGVYLEESRTVGPFVGIHVQDGVSAVVTSGEPGQTVRVIGDSNVVPHIETTVEAEPVGLTTIQVLHVSVTKNYVPTIPPSVIVSVPSFVSVRADDVPTVDVRKAEASTFTVDASGISRVTLVGAGAEIDATLGGDALLDATEYVTSAADVALSGRTTAKLRSNGPVNGTAVEASLVDDLLGTGPCFVTTSGSARAICNSY